MENPSRDDLIVLLFVLTDDFLRESLLSRPGPKARISDSELLTMAMLQCLYGEESERNFLRTYAPEIVALFGKLPSLKEYNRRLKEHDELLGFLWQLMLSLLAPEIETGKAFIDSAPIPVTRCLRFPHGSYHRECGHGYCASKRLHFWGYRLHLIVSPRGIPLQFTILGADIDERSVLQRSFLHDFGGWLLGADTGYILSDERKRQLLRETGVTLLHPYRCNQRKKNTPEEWAQLKGRGIIERIFGWLESQLGIESTLAKSYAGLTSRIWRKLLFLGFCMAFASMLGYDLLQVSRLWC